MVSTISLADPEFAEASAVLRATNSTQAAVGKNGDCGLAETPRPVTRREREAVSKHRSHQSITPLYAVDPAHQTMNSVTRILGVVNIPMLLTLTRAKDDIARCIFERIR